MRREDLRAFISAGVDELSPTVQFNSGRITEFNSKRSNKYPFIWLESLARTPIANGLVWNIVLHIAKKDKMDSSPEQYEKIIDECDYIAQQLMAQYKLLLEGYDQLVIEAGSENGNAEPFIHRHADDTSGVILSFELQDFSPANVC